MILSLIPEYGTLGLRLLLEVEFGKQKLVCIACDHVHIQVCSHCVSVCLCVRGKLTEGECTCMCENVCVHVCSLTCECVCMCTQMCVLVYACICFFVCMCAYDVQMSAVYVCVCSVCRMRVTISPMENKGNNGSVDVKSVNLVPQ